MEAIGNHNDSFDLHTIVLLCIDHTVDGECMDGFDGKRCEVAVCSSKYCNNNGLCTINEDDQLKCECNEGFQGQRCEIELCDSIICENGSCDAGICTCNQGYISIENICRETCDLNPCEVLSFTSVVNSVNNIIRTKKQ